MLRVYAASWCPHCSHTIEFLNQHHIPFEYLDIEEQPPVMIAKLIEVNGGEDWVVPTLEFNGIWRPGQVFDAEKLARDLEQMGVLTGAGV